MFVFVAVSLKILIPTLLSPNCIVVKCSFFDLETFLLVTAESVPQKFYVGP